jgi:SAM-dependent methyltransferase
MASEDGGLVLDCFVGSGTTVAVAQKLGHRWIGCDINKGTIQLAAKRLQAVIDQQVEQARKDESKSRQGKLIGVDEPQDEEASEPAQLAFTVWRVNDYDLAIQHNEAVIDPAYDGYVFNVVVSDVPEKKTDLVKGRYKLPGRNAQTTVAVKIIDMLGEEALVVEQV